MVEHTGKPEWGVSIGLDRIDRDPDFILATLLRDKEFPHDWDEDERYVRLRLTSEGERIWDYMLHRTPEIRALCNAWTIWTPRKQLRHCNWDKDTRKRVLALYWERYSQSCEDAEARFENSDERLEATTAAKKARRNMKRQLGKLSPFSPDDIRALLEPVVDKVLAQVATEGYVEYPNR